MSGSSVRRLFSRALSRAHDPHELFARGRDALSAGSINDARTALAQAIATAPDDVALALACAELFSAAQLRDDALAIHRRLLERPQPPFESVIAMTDALLDMGSPDTAIALVRHALAQTPDDFPLERVLAICFERAGHLVEARDRAYSLRARAPTDVEVNRLIGRVTGRLGDTHACAEAWRRVVALTGSADLEARTALGIALSQAERHPEALRELTDVAALADSSSAYANLGMALLGAGRAAEALHSFERAIARDGRDGQGHLGAGIALLELGRNADAVGTLERATELVPASEIAWYNLGLALRADDKLPAARRALARAAGIAPHDAGIQDLLDELAAPPAQRDTGDITGDIGLFPLPDLIEFLRSGHKTGTVVVTARGGAGLVRLSHGLITSAKAPGTPRLGELLVGGGILSKDELDRALTAQSDQNDQPEKLGSVLISRRAVGRDRLERAIFQQTLTALEEILSWPEGTFSFQQVRARSDDVDEDVIAFDAQHLMMELMRLTDERRRTAPDQRRPKP